jgi:hypothetical protein
MRMRGRPAAMVARALTKSTDAGTRKVRLQCVF